jgi:hypothetical protein
VPSENRPARGDPIGVRFEQVRQRDSGVHRYAIPIVDLQAGDAIDRRDG